LHGVTKEFMVSVNPNPRGIVQKKPRFQICVYPQNGLSEKIEKNMLGHKLYTVVPSNISHFLAEK